MRKRILFTAAITLCIAATAYSQLIINELMQSNIDCITDDLNEFPDSWVELYNPTSRPVDLAEYSIGITDDAATSYALPSVQLVPMNYALIYCDKEATGLHTDFRLESGKGGAVYLFNNGVLVDKVEGLKKQPAPNIAYGRLSVDSSTFGYQNEPTPGKRNCGVLVKDILPEPVFSQPGRVGTDRFSLTLSLPDDCPEAKIYYTKDGSEPTAKSTLYKSPISINSTTTIRAKIIADGYMSPRSTTHSYIFHPRQATIPVVSIVTNHAYFYDTNLGIYVQGSNPSDPNYRHDWRRPINVEIFMAEGEESVINQLCETRVKGAATRDAALKSLVLYANKRFGTKRLEYEFFPDDTPEKTDWKSIELRNSGNDFDYLYFRDALIQRTMGRHADIDWQPYRPAIIYINGTYKGMLNIRSRSNEDLIYTMYDGIEDVDVVENWEEVKEGSLDNFNAFKEFFAGTDHTYEEFEEWMDVEEFANTMIMNTYFDNKDFPGNNITCWRQQTPESRWRWIAKDTDFGLGLYGSSYSYKTFNWLYDNGYDSSNTWGNAWEATRLFRRLMNTEKFRDMFIDRCAIYIGDFLNDRIVKAYIDEMSGAIAKEYPSHRAMINPWWPNYSTELSNARSWIESRTPFFYKHLSEYFGLGTPCSIIIDKDKSDDVTLIINGIPLKYRTFDGKYFAGRTLNISAACSEEGKEVTAWSVSTTASGRNTITRYEGSTLSLTVPTCDRIQIRSILGEAGINDVVNDEQPAIDTAKAIQVFDLSGRDMGMFDSLAAASASLSAGFYIIAQDGKSQRILIE